MPPKKLPTRQKKHKNTGASSSQRPDLLSHQTYAKARLQKLKKLEFMNHQYLNGDLLDDYGLLDIVLNTIKDNTWLTLFEIQEPAYRDVTLEFLSTMTISSSNQVTTMKFQAYEEVREIDIKHIGYHLGLYATPEDAMELPNAWPTDMDAATYWSTLISPRRDPFAPSRSRSSTFAAVEHKLLHHILAHTICAKKTSHGKVTTFDIFYLYCMITGYRINVGVEVANFFDRQINDKRSNVILCGGYITALLKGMGIFQQPEGDEGVACKQVTDAPFRLWNLTKVPNSDSDEEEDIQPLEIAPAERTEHASSSRSPPPVSDYEKLRREIRGLRKENKKERVKHKKFRTTLIEMFKSTIACINPEAAQNIQYQTSDEEEGSPESDS